MHFLRNCILYFVHFCFMQLETLARSLTERTLSLHTLFLLVLPSSYLSSIFAFSFRRLWCCDDIIILSMRTFTVLLSQRKCNLFVLRINLQYFRCNDITF